MSGREPERAATSAQDKLAALTPDAREAVLARLRKRRRGETLSIEPREDPLDGWRSASFAQEQLFLAQRLDPEATSYHMPLALRVQGALDTSRLERAIGALIERQEVLRTVYREAADRVQQRVLPRPAAALTVHDAPAGSESEQLRWVRERAHAVLSEPFDLTTGPVLRARVYRLGVEHFVVLLVIHHIAADGWSIAVLARELLTLYTTDGDAGTLPELAVRFRDFADAQRDARAHWDGAAQFWRDGLAGDPPAGTLVMEGARAHAGMQSVRVPFTIERATATQVAALAARCKVTPFAVLLAALRVLVAHCTGELDCILGMVVAGRPAPALGALVGLFAQTLPVRVACNAQASFESLVCKEGAFLLTALRHQDVPFVPRVLFDRGAAPAHAQTLLILHNTEPPQLAMPGFEVEPLIFETGSADHDLVLNLTPTASGEYAGDVHYRGGAEERAEAERIAILYRRTLAWLTGAAERPIHELSLLDDDERARIETWNHTPVVWPSDSSVEQRFLEQAERTPDAIGLRYEGESQTYRQLRDRIACASAQLRLLGVGPESVVAICAPRSPELVVAIMAVLVAGAAYLPIDVDGPDERTQRILADASPSVALVAQGIAWSDAACPCVVRLDERFGASAEGRALDRDATTSKADQTAAYVIFTSGSTGRPKGVVNTRQALLNRLLWQQERLPLSARDRVLQKTPYTFDVSVWEFLWPLMVGSTLVLARPGGQREADYLQALIEQEGVTTLHFVPSMLEAFLEQLPAQARLGCLERVLCSGEALRPQLAREFQRRLPHVELHNLYGPTEAAIDVSAYALPAGEVLAEVPIGRPIANLTLHVLSSSGQQPLPVGVTGELFIGGVGLARGYLNAPELTAERFVPSPFARGGERLYRTGDLARYRADGLIEYRGRSDSQVKVRGHRIELEEVEQALSQHSAVRLCAAAVEPDAAGSLRLVAYACVREPETSEASLRDRLQRSLPAAMVPSEIVLLDSLPLTTSGKVDRRALRGRRASARSSTPPRIALEVELGDIAAQLLQRPSVGVDQSLLDLGAHSLLLTRLVARFRERTGVTIPLRAVFDEPSVEAISLAALEAAFEECDHADRDRWLQELETENADARGSACASC